MSVSADVSLSHRQRGAYLFLIYEYKQRSWDTDIASRIYLEY